MKRFLVCLIFSFLWLVSYGQGIKFFEGHWKEALESAKAQEKLVFVDAYAKWCGPCKMMAKKVFTDAKVGDFFNDNFINLKIDMEEANGIEFGKKYPVSAYPTLFFIDGEGKLVIKSVGAKQVDKLLDLGKEALMQDDKSELYALAYEEGKRDYDFMIKFISSLNKVGKPSLKIANDYIRSNPNLSDKQMALFLMTSTIEADSKIFDLFVEQRDLIGTLTSDKEVEEVIMSACRATVRKAIEFESEMLLKEAQEKCKSYLKPEARCFQYQSEIDYYGELGYEKEFIDAVRSYSKKCIKDDAKAMVNLANKLRTEYDKSVGVLAEAERIGRSLVKSDENSVEYLMLLTRILIDSKKFEDALEFANKALLITKEKQLATRNIEGTIRYIESKMQQD